MANFNSGNFKIGPCVIAYKGSLLGGTKGGVNISMEAEIYEVTCDQSYGQPIKKIPLSRKVVISMTMLEVEKGLELLLSNGNLNNACLGSDLIAAGGELLLTPVNSNDTVGYRFPNAVIDLSSNYSLFSSEINTVSIKFTAEADENGTFMERITLN